MATITQSFNTPFSVKINAGDRMLITAPVKRMKDSPETSSSLSANPLTGASANIYTSLSPLAKIIANPLDPEVCWSQWAIGTITPASTVKLDVFAGYFTAIRVDAIAGQVIVEGGS